MKSTKQTVCSIILVALTVSAAAPMHAVPAFPALKQCFMRTSMLEAKDALKWSDAKKRTPYERLTQADKNALKNQMSKISEARGDTAATLGCGGLALGALLGFALHRTVKLGTLPSMGIGLLGGLLPLLTLGVKWAGSDQPREELSSAVQQDANNFVGGLLRDVLGMFNFAGGLFGVGERPQAANVDAELAGL